MPRWGEKPRGTGGRRQGTSFLTHLCIVSAVDDELPSLHLEKDRRGQALSWSWGYDPKPDVVLLPRRPWRGAGLPSQGCASESSGRLRTGTIQGF